MTPERHQQIGKLYQAALELEGGNRHTFLEQACAGDETLRMEVESLLTAHAEEGSFLHVPALEVAAELLTESGAARIIGSQFSHFQILSRLGAGGMGEVFLAKDTLLGRKVALKLLPSRFTHDAQRIARFEQEARAASGLNHPNIITIYEIGQAEALHFIAAEYIDGQTLRKRMAGSRIGLDEALEIAIQVAKALAEAHAAGIIHRDIKPENVMVRPDGLVKVLDFGLAKLTERGQADTEAPVIGEIKTDSGIVLGTTHYMSPEQARGCEVDSRTDLFSLGVMLYEMVAGRKPFVGATTSNVIAAILESEPPPLAETVPEAPLELEHVLTRALRKSREERYQTAETLADDLDRLKRMLGSTSQKTGSRGKATTNDNKRRTRITANSEVQDTQPISRILRRKRTAIVTAMALAILPLTIIALLVRNHLRPVKETTGEQVNFAVLPFYTSNAPEEIRFLGIGIPDAIIMRLSNVKQIRPRPTSAVLRYENQNIDPQEVGHALACEYLLTGVVLESGEQFRVSVQLIQVKDGNTLWGQSYDLARQDLLSLQDTIAERVSAALKIRMTAAERERVYRRYTENMAAYEHYLQGRAHLRGWGKGGKLAAAAAFRKALQLDPQYALAHAGLATAAASLRHGRVPEAEVMTWEDQARQAAKRALELAPDLAEAHEALAALYRYTDFNWEQTIEESRKALDLNPNLDEPHYYLARAYYHLGLLELVEPEVRAALEINPENRAEAAHLRIVAALYSRLFDKAFAIAEEADRSIGEILSEWPDAFFYIGERERAEAMLIRSKEEGLRGQLEDKAMLASFIATRAKRKEAEALLREVTSATETFHHASYSAGAAYAQLGDRAKARLWLARAAQTGFPCYPWFRDDPLLDPLRGDPEFERFMADLKKRWEFAKFKYAPKL